jgi:putative ABC transport system permease protein
VSVRRRLLGFVVALALMVFPRSFRRQHGDALRHAFHDRLRSRSGSSRVRRAWLVVHLLADMVGSGMRERLADTAETWSWPASARHTDGIFRRSSGMLATDLRHAVRLLFRNPLFAAVGILAFAIGIGANVAIFSVVNAVLLRPLPYHDPDRLVMVWSNNMNEGRARNPISPANFRDYREQSQAFEGLEAMHSFLAPERLTVDGATEVVQALSLTPGMFRLLGRQPEHGRTPGDDETGGIVISHAFWERRFGADPSIIGRKITLSNQPAVIIGVMPADFVFPYRSMLEPSGFARALVADMWVPLQFTGPRMVDEQGGYVRNVHYLAAVGRLADGVSMERAQADLATVARRLEHEYPGANAAWGATVVPLLEQTVGDVSPALALLAAGVGILLLIACVNVANMVLARGLARQGEIAIRAALGASRWRLVRQLMTETLIMSIVGGALAFFVAAWGIDVLIALAPPEIPRLEGVRPDPIVLGFAVAVAVVAGCLAGLGPALAATRRDRWRPLQQAGRGTSPAHRKARAVLVVSQIAMAAVLAVGALLLARSFEKLLDVNPGFVPERLLTLQMNVPDRLATAEHRRQFYAELFERVEALPGVIAAGGTTRLPLGSTNVTTQVMVEGSSADPARLPEVEFVAPCTGISRRCGSRCCKDGISTTATGRMGFLLSS